MQNKFSFFSILLSSVYNRESYRVITNWSLAKALKYFIFLIVLYDLIAMCFQLPLIISGAYEVTEWAIRKLPNMRIEEGTLFVEGDQQKYVYWKEDEILFEIDAQAEKAEQERMEKLLRVEFGAIVLKNKIIMKGALNLQEIVYPQDYHQLIAPHTLMRWRDLFLWTSPLILFFSNAIFLLFSKLIETFIFAGIAFLMVRMRASKALFSSCLHLAVFTLGPALFFSFIIASIGWVVSYYMLIYFCIRFYYLMRGLYILSPSIPDLQLTDDTT